MTKKLIFILLLLLIAGCSSPVEDSILVNKNGLMHLPDSDKPFSGEVFTNYTTGEKSYQATYEDGLVVKYSYLNRDGSVKEPIDVETLLERSGLRYKANSQEPYTGEVFLLYANGIKKYSGAFKDGEIYGEWISYYENGQVHEKNNYKFS